MGTLEENIKAAKADFLVMAERIGISKNAGFKPYTMLIFPEPTRPERLKTLDLEITSADAHQFALLENAHQVAIGRSQLVGTLGYVGGDPGGNTRVNMAVQVAMANHFENLINAKRADGTTAMIGDIEDYEKYKKETLTELAKKVIAREAIIQPIATKVMDQSTGKETIQLGRHTLTDEQYGLDAETLATTKAIAEKNAKTLQEAIYYSPNAAKKLIPSKNFKFLTTQAAVVMMKHENLAEKLHEAIQNTHNPKSTKDQESDTGAKKTSEIDMALALIFDEIPPHLKLLTSTDKLKGIYNESAISPEPQNKNRQQNNKNQQKNDKARTNHR